jgi:sec-independent protein translocase protein TatA
MFGVGAPELVLILIIALVIFGPSKLPQIGASLGKGIRDFKSAMQEIDAPPAAAPSVAGTQPTAASTAAQATVPTPVPTQADV